MKDFCTGRDIDIQGLMRMLKHAEEEPLLKMDRFITKCGTSGCLVGTDILRNGIEHTIDVEGRAYYTKDGKTNPMREYGRIELNLSDNENKFLFLCHHLDYKSSCSASWLDRVEAIRRLRKFIYWKMRKAELLEDLQTARTQEGNWNFSQKVLEEVR